MKRRSFLALPVALAPLTAPLIAPRLAHAARPDYPPVTSGHPLVFPRDFGAHLPFRTEWWYATGWLNTRDGAALGFQVTFFRSRPDLDDANPSAFAPHQLLFANVALSDPRAGALQLDQRSARRGFGLADASETDTNVQIGDWSLQRSAAADGASLYRVDIAAADFAFAFTMRATQPVLLNGTHGVSRKGPLPEQASFYYSEPALRVAGMLTRQRRAGGQPEAVEGSAWLDHEWSSALLAEQAVGWDWIGINLDDGTALMAIRIRDKAGRTFWGGGTLRDAHGATRELAQHEVSFTPLRWWRSPHTEARYPVAMRVDAGGLQLVLTPLFDDQEVDSRASTGAVYWEGAVTAARPASDGRSAAQTLGRGYLELTGYVEKLEF
ncbi:MAG TPA: carotenoid 1,2-hydratase [Paraburkholderia sp.]|jgi:predicted secreted hydrolase|nr:carotenoid 1,2-hydratase [Paraburkholderia sp.]